MSDPEELPKNEETVAEPPKETEPAKEAEATEEKTESKEDPRSLPKEELGVRPGYVPGSDEQPSAA